MEQRTIEPDLGSHRVKFGINDRAAFKEDEVRHALGDRFGKGVTVEENRPVDPPDGT